MQLQHTTSNSSLDRAVGSIKQLDIRSSNLHPEDWRLARIRPHSIDTSSCWGQTVKVKLWESNCQTVGVKLLRSNRWGQTVEWRLRDSLDKKVRYSIVESPSNCCSQTVAVKLLQSNCCSQTVAVKLLQQDTKKVRYSIVESPSKSFGHEKLDDNRVGERQRLHLEVRMCCSVLQCVAMCCSVVQCVE